ncbi:AMP-binding enzyme C-terminal domain-containing protein [Actinomadura meyerae]|uniref:AMP-binding enzyme C-terminal domain-containing protein n=1 Tax=Actinomadura meyerae TaxID=240840 RepID=A0A239NW61_9ACTN|nr:phosphopantetheine-binding protein [Actinomadura meyerae]SNT58668.1 AMP-binding enzyme C-terminal domain-containing protein [Actinomadura meyerae]
MSDTVVPELGTPRIEEVLTAHPDVREAVVMPRGAFGPGETALVVPVAYAVGPDLAGHVAAELGVAAIPATIALLPEIPRGPGGAVDSAAVRERLASWPGVYRFELPRTAAERRVADLWCRVLGRRWVGVHDDFIELGGDSRTAALLLAELRAEPGADVTMGDLFELATVARLARRFGAADD